jgi:hypothetical protein
MRTENNSIPKEITACKSREKRNFRITLKRWHETITGMMT